MKNHHRGQKPLPSRRELLANDPSRSLKRTTVGSFLIKRENVGWMVPPPNEFGAEQQDPPCGPSWSHIQVFAVGYFRLPSQGHPRVFLLNGTWRVQCAEEEAEESHESGHPIWREGGDVFSIVTKSRIRTRESCRTACLLERRNQHFQHFHL